MRKKKDTVKRFYRVPEEDGGYPCPIPMNGKLCRRKYVSFNRYSEHLKRDHNFIERSVALTMKRADLF